MLPHRLFMVFTLLAHLSLVPAWALTRDTQENRDAKTVPQDLIQILPLDPRIHSRELRDALEPLLHQTAHEANVLFGDAFTTSASPSAPAGSSSEYSLSILAQQQGDGSSLMLRLTRNKDSRSSEHFPLLGPWDTHLPRLAAHAIRYLHYSLREAHTAPPGETPRFFDEFNSSMISMMDLGHTARVFPMSIDIGPGGHIFLGALFVAVELDHLYREVAKPGSEIYSRDSTNYGVDVRVTAAGTVFARGMGEDFFIIHPGHPRHQQLRLSIANPMASAALTDGSYVATTGQRTVRVSNSQVEEIDLRPHESAFTMILAAGPDATIWSWDAVLGAAVVYTADGERLDSIVPLMPEAHRRSVRGLRVLPDGSFILLSTAALYRFDQLGTPIWRMDSPPPPLTGDFSLVTSIAVDAERGYIYALNPTAQRMFRLIDLSMRDELSPFEQQILALNSQLVDTRGSREALERLSQLYEEAGAPGLALEMRRSILERSPFDAEANDAFNRSEGLLIAERATHGAERALDVRRTIGPESAAQYYTIAVQQFEQALSRLRGFPAEHERVSRILRTFQQDFRALDAPPPRPPSVVVAGLTDIFPALIQSYRTTPVGELQITNTLDEELADLRVTTSFRFADFPAQTEPIPRVPSGETIEIPVYVTLAPEVLTLQEDIPVMFSIELDYRHAGAEQHLRLDRTVMVRRNTALLWDDSRKLASFITPNDEIIQTFALEIVRSNRLAEDSTAGLVSEKTQQAALLADALGAYGIRYVEDPASPFTEVFGRSDVLDTVRFPRTTLRVRSGDCDDTASLLASLYEAVGIRTAIMTSPGHVFIAFDTEEPATNAWIYGDQERQVIRHNGTLWIPVETTILEGGFPAAWAEASRLMRVHTNEIEFLPVAEQRALYPAIPLGPAGFTVVAPAATAVQSRVERSREELRDAVYYSRVTHLHQEAAGQESGSIAQLTILNRIGVLHARAGRQEMSRELFGEILATAPDNIPALINLANLELLQGEYHAALSRAEQVLRSRRFSVAALNIAIQSALHLEDHATARELLETMHAVDTEAATRVSALHPSLRRDSSERASAATLVPQPAMLFWQDTPD